MKKKVGTIVMHRGDGHDSCRERERKLEAERDDWKAAAIEKDDILDRVKDYPELKARAEKAEAFAVELAKDHVHEKGILKDRAEKAEGFNIRDRARIVELEKRLESANAALAALLAEREKEKAARFLSDFEKEHPGETRRILEKAWEIQQRTGKPVHIAQLADELNEAREREEKT